MMRYFFILILFACLSCSNERVLQLPELENAQVTEVFDVSPAYIFYDESQPDSTLLNRKNLISTTNWLVNVDKRLTLQQAIPHIIFLQDKKRNAEVHKNENAKNYFTCNDTSIQNLGFLEFTDVYYLMDGETVQEDNNELCHVIISSLSEIEIISSGNVIDRANNTNLLNSLNKALAENQDLKTVLLTFSKTLSFQDYITIKSITIPYSEVISNNEIVF